MPHSQSPHNRLVELVHLLSGAPAHVAEDAVECARIRQPCDGDPFALVAESLLMLRSRPNQQAVSDPGATHQLRLSDPPVISLVGD